MVCSLAWPALKDRGTWGFMTLWARRLPDKDKLRKPNSILVLHPITARHWRIRAEGSGNLAMIPPSPLSRQIPGSQAINIDIRLREATPSVVCFFLVKLLPTDFKAKMHQIRFPLGLFPGPYLGPYWGSLQCSQRDLSCTWGGLLVRWGSVKAPPPNWGLDPPVLQDLLSSYNTTSYIVVVIIK